MLNEHNPLPGWIGSHSKAGIIYIAITLIALLIYFNEQAVHPIWFIVSFGIAFIYFYVLQYCSINWAIYNDRKFEKKLFFSSLLFRLFASILLMIVAKITWGIPDYVGAVDALTYHKEALIVADLLRNF